MTRRGRILLVSFAVLVAWWIAATRINFSDALMGDLATRGTVAVSVVTVLLWGIFAWAAARFGRRGFIQSAAALWVAALLCDAILGLSLLAPPSLTSSDGYGLLVILGAGWVLIHSPVYGLIAALPSWIPYVVQSILIDALMLAVSLVPHYIKQRALRAPLRDAS